MKWESVLLKQQIASTVNELGHVEGVYRKGRGFIAKDEDKHHLLSM